MNTRSFLFLVAAVAIIAGCADTQPARPPATPPATTPPLTEPPMTDNDEEVAPDLHADVRCSEPDVRTVIATLSWRENQIQAAAQRIDVTVFKEGFDKGLFATAPADKGGKFEFAPALRRMEREPGRAFELVADPRPDSRKEFIAIDIRNLEPRLLYRWRVASRTDRGWVSSPVVTLESPPCIADEKEAR